MSASDFVLQNRETGLWEVYYCCQRVAGAYANKQAATVHLMRVQKGLVAWVYDVPTAPDLTKPSDTPPPSKQTRGRSPFFKSIAAREFTARTKR